MRISFFPFDDAYWPPNLATGLQVFLDDKQAVNPIAADEERGEVQWIELDAHGNPKRDDDGQVCRITRRGRVVIKMRREDRERIEALIARPPLFKAGDHVMAYLSFVELPANELPKPSYGVVQWRCSGRAEADGSYSYAVVFNVGPYSSADPLEVTEAMLGRGALQ